MKGYRKLTVATLVVVLSFIALMVDKLQGAQFASIVVWVMGLFGSANAAPSVAQAIALPKEKRDERAPE